jgi:TM2 domain-containing membrane protein YozV
LQACCPVVPAAFHFSVFAARTSKALDILGRFVGFALRIDGSLRFMGFGRFYPCFVLTGKLKIGLSGIFVESDITLIRLVFFIFQFNVYGLSGFELVVLLIIQFFAPESFGASCGWLC